MSDVILKLLANGSEQVEQLGEYIAIKESNVSLDIHINGVGSMKMSKGEVWRIRDGFESFTIENYDAIAAEVLLAVGFGDYRAALSVGNLDKINTIVNPVNVNTHDVGSILNNVNVNTHDVGSILNDVNVKNSIQPISHFQNYSVGASVLTIVTPSANVNGIRVLNAGVNSNSLTTTAFIANQVSPTLPTDSYNNTMNMIFCRSWMNFNPLLQNEFVIPAGLGLYMCSDSESMSSIDYEVL